MKFFYTKKYSKIVIHTQVTLTKFMNQCNATLTVKEEKVSCPVSGGHASLTLCPVELGHTLRRTCKLDSLTYEGLSLKAVKIM